MFSMIRLEAVILTLAILVERKIWPLSFEIALSLFKAVCCLLFVAEEVFFIHHMFQLEMWHILSHSQAPSTRIRRFLYPQIFLCGYT